MLLISSHPRSLLWMSLCLYILLGYTEATNIEATQPGTGIRKVDSGIPTRSPYITKNSDPYFDLAGTNESVLTIPPMSRAIKGITATSKSCPVRSLVLKTGFLLDEDIFTYCPIMNLTLKGRRWRCLHQIRVLQRPGLVVHADNAICNDAWHNNSSIPTGYSMPVAVQKFQEFGISSCLIEECSCKWYFEKEKASYNMSMDCEGLGLTDNALAKMDTLPSHVKNINLGRNNLSSMDALIDYLKPNHEELEVLFLDHNQMTVLPRLGRSFPRIIDISLANNAIEEIDLEDFEALVSREGLLLSLEGNPFRCDSHMYDFWKTIHQRCKNGWKFCNKYLKKVTCRREPDGEPVPLYLMSDEETSSEVDWWLILNITLGVLNAFMIYLIIDLIMILANIKGNEERRPKMDYVVCGLKSVFCRMCSEIAVVTDKDN